MLYVVKIAELADPSWSDLSRDMFELFIRIDIDSQLLEARFGAPIAYSLISKFFLYPSDGIANVPRFGISPTRQPQSKSHAVIIWIEWTFSSVISGPELWERLIKFLFEILQCSHS